MRVCGKKMNSCGSGKKQLEQERERLRQERERLREENERLRQLEEAQRANKRQINTHELPHHRRVVQRLFHGRVRQVKPCCKK